MNHDELDQVYTAMAQTLTRVGEAQTSLFLSILSLSLIARLTDARDAAALLAQAEAACLANGAVANYPASDPLPPT
ncbi:hypothetical protein QEP16_25085 [Achromobacter insolitus]|jgi:hypothetical protein|uniref:DUF2783 domain-containing protein n=1 Tax=Achromobacter insolitus TaxID=217204 RepID=A0A6S7F7V1_9BURK|nr:hypothetical protein [Achromobacter insolitus]GLK96406.1 hypothetical protein GCM10008164_41480 [Achromobacter xylosoxidans]APX77143.1 hypothetical protein BUW96_21375 [Achromobacter insolitus]AVG42889.1 hypothetical protein MC81_27755 [Achromobacter insolitus]AXA73034.1 hypothetical protein CE205_21680 [Achromobacter insolitus]MDH3066616.1 hypothetical protein [Achromobacter insolitus]